MKNSEKIVFTPGPGSLTEENVMGLGPCFSRNDSEYLATMEHVHKKILALAGQKHVASFQGSGTLAIEIAMVFPPDSIAVLWAAVSMPR